MPPATASPRWVWCILFGVRASGLPLGGGERQATPRCDLTRDLFPTHKHKQLKCDYSVPCERYVAVPRCAVVRSMTVMPPLVRRAAQIKLSKPHPQVLPPQPEVRASAAAATAAAAEASVTVFGASLGGDGGWEESAGATAAGGGRAAARGAGPVEIGPRRCVDSLWCVSAGLGPDVVSSWAERPGPNSDCCAVSLALHPTKHMSPNAVAAGVFLRTFYQCLSEGIIIQSSVLALMYVHLRKERDRNGSFQS